jgi:hypothetical protein
MTHPNQFRTYFSDLVSNSATNPNIPIKIESFYYADARRIIEANRSEIAYPTLWLEVPSISEKHFSTSDKRLRWDITFAILKSSAIDDYALQNEIWDTTFDIAKGVITQIETDKSIWKMEENSLVFVPISNALTDNDYGWRVMLRAVSKQYFNTCPI